MILSAQASPMPGSVMSCSLLAVFKSINSASDLARRGFLLFLCCARRSSGLCALSEA